MRLALARHIASPFVWEETDCTMSFEVVRAITEWDPIADVRGYTSAQEAMRNLREAGFRTVLELVEARFPEISPSEAQRGDLGYPADVDVLMSPALINGPVAHSKSLAGAVILPRGQIVRAFAV